MASNNIIRVKSNDDNDLFLSRDPEITFFKSVYRRYTNFASEVVKVDFDSDVEFIQSNDENIELPIAFYEESGTAIRTSLTNLPLEDFINGERIFAVKDKKNNLHKINKIKITPSIIFFSKIAKK